MPAADAQARRRLQGDGGGHHPLRRGALNAYLYHFGVANDHVTAEHLTSLVALVQQHLSADEGDAAAATRAFFTNTRLHLDEKKKADDDAAARFKEIEWA